jgi:hypothetical protein
MMAYHCCRLNINGCPKRRETVLSSTRRKLQREVTLLCRMVEATLKEYTQHIGVCLMATYFLPTADADQCYCMLQGTEYDLVFICGGNGSVANHDGPDILRV